MSPGSSSCESCDSRGVLESHELHDTCIIGSEGRSVIGEVVGKDLDLDLDRGRLQDVEHVDKFDIPAIWVPLEPPTAAGSGSSTLKHFPASIAGLGEFPSLSLSACPPFPWQCPPTNAVLGAAEDEAAEGAAGREGC